LDQSLVRSAQTLLSDSRLPTRPRKNLHYVTVSMSSVVRYSTTFVKTFTFKYFQNFTGILQETPEIAQDSETEYFSLQQQKQFSIHRDTENTMQNNMRHISPGHEHHKLNSTVLIYSMYVTIYVHNRLALQTSQQCLVLIYTHCTWCGTVKCMSYFLSVRIFLNKLKPFITLNTY